MTEQTLQEKLRARGRMGIDYASPGRGHEPEWLPDMLCARAADALDAKDAELVALRAHRGFSLPPCPCCGRVFYDWSTTNKHWSVLSEVDRKLDICPSCFADKFAERLLERLASAEEALRPFADHGVDENDPTNEAVTSDMVLGLMRDRICDWFGPSSFQNARAYFAKWEKPEA